MYQWHEMPFEIKLFFLLFLIFPFIIIFFTLSCLERKNLIVYFKFSQMSNMLVSLLIGLNVILPLVLGPYFSLKQIARTELLNTYFEDSPYLYPVSILLCVLLSFIVLSVLFEISLFLFSRKFRIYRKQIRS